MSHSSKLSNGLDELTRQLSDSLTSLDANNKPDFREINHLDSPVSPLLPPRAAATTSSSGSSGSGGPQPRSGHSGELTNLKPGHQTRSDPRIYYSGGGCGSVTSPVGPNVLPTGNICPSGRILRSGLTSTLTNRSSKTDVLRSGTGNYGHGSIMRGGGGVGVATGTAKCSSSIVRLEGAGSDPEELKRTGNEMHKRGHFAEALSMYEQAILLAPGNAAYRSNRAAALIGLGRVGEAVRECEEAVRLDPSYWRAYQRLGALLIRLGHVEIARRYLCFPGQHPDPAEMQKLQLVEKHINKCSNARKVNDWNSVLREVDAATVAGADYSPQLFMCRVESLLKLHQLEDAESCLSNIPKLEPYPKSCSQARFVGMLSEAYPLFVRAQIEMARGRFESAVTAAEKAGLIDPQNVEIAVLLKNVRLVARARARGNDLFKSERFTEACSAYGEGLKLDPSNSVLYCNRAACWFKLGLWERSIDDCNQALHIQPNYMKALLRRAASNSKLERWADAVRDYEFLRRELPDDNEVAESLFHTQVALKKSRGEEVYNMKFGGEVEEISGLEQLRAAISLPGIAVVHFYSSSNLHCKQISPFVDTLCGRYPSLNFLKVDIEQCPTMAIADNVRIVPTFKIYKDGNKVKEFVCPSRDTLEQSVRHYSV